MVAGQMRFYKIYFRQHQRGILCFFLCCFIFMVVFSLYHLPLGAVLYPMAICMVVGTGFLAADYIHAKKKHGILQEIGRRSGELMEGFPESEGFLEADYREIMERLRQELRSVKDAMNLNYANMVDYYTIWVHQIKTPIAALRLYLEGEDSENARRMREEVFRIEQYVGMVLAFLRLDCESTDYVFEECEIDEIVRGAVKKFAGQFIRKKIALKYEPLCLRVVTDEKWFSFCLEQVLSNALKYTRSGSVSITLESAADAEKEYIALEPAAGAEKECIALESAASGEKGHTTEKENSGRNILCIRDTGIGIAPEDLPRVFEKGYTGYHGREDKRASGIGLYLCRRICANLGHPIALESQVGVGTVVRIDLEQKRLKTE